MGEDSVRLKTSIAVGGALLGAFIEGAIGTAAIEIFFTKREQFHSFLMNAHASLIEPATRARTEP